jgi:hypothetical protein
VEYCVWQEWDEWIMVSTFWHFHMALISPVVITVPVCSTFTEAPAAPIWRKICKPQAAWMNKKCACNMPPIQLHCPAIFRGFNPKNWWWCHRCFPRWTVPFMCLIQCNRTYSKLQLEFARKTMEEDMGLMGLPQWRKPFDQFKKW